LETVKNIADLVIKSFLSENIIKKGDTGNKIFFNKQTKMFELQ
jgi:hypothetical protein